MPTRFPKRLFLISLVLVIAMGAIFPFDALAEREELRREQDRSLIFIPILFYTPETKIGAGASIVHYFHSSKEDSSRRPSSVQPTFIYTQERQIVSAVSTELYWSQATNRLAGAIGYVKFPDSFYGIGQKAAASMQEDYTQETFLLDAAYSRRVVSDIRVGGHFEFRHASVLETEEGGILAPGTVLGSRGGDVSGLGISASWDSRDDIFYPKAGSYHSWSATFFDANIGGDFAFNRHIVDLRKFISLGASTVVAFQSLGHFSTGSPPFQMLAAVGGQNRARGYYGGRYRDRHALVAQAEFRRRIIRRWGIVLFVGGANVAPDLDGFRLSEAKPFAGYGVRYLFSPERGINVRLDFGYGDDSSGFYMTIGEAF